MIAPRHLLESIAALAKIYQRDKALAPIERKLSQEMRRAFREQKRVFLQEFERVGPGLFGESIPAPIEGDRKSVV